MKKGRFVKTHLKTNKKKDVDIKRQMKKTKPTENAGFISFTCRFVFTPYIGAAGKGVTEGWLL